LQEIAGYHPFAVSASNGTDAAVSDPVVTSREAALDATAPSMERETAGSDHEEEDLALAPESNPAGAGTTSPEGEVPVAPAPGAPAGDEHPPADDIQRLTERIAPMLAEALAGAMRELYQHTAGDRQRMDVSLAAVNDIGQQLRSISAEWSLLRQQMERMEGRLNAQEADRQQVAERLSKFEDGQKSLERRLEIQAGGIRALHVTASERGDRREEFRATLRRLEEILGAFSLPAKLPDGL
jgi:hypothetical protein